MFDDIKQKIILPSFSLREKVSMLLVLLGVSISSFGLVSLWRQTNGIASAQQLPTHQEVGSQELQLTIDVGGAVEKPGIYTVNSGERVAKAVELAGGFASTADPYFITQSLNLAKMLEDEEKVYIPFVGELSTQATESNSSVSTNTLISINTASQSELDSLDGVGEKRAEDIMAGRPYKALNELVSKNVISESLLESIKDSIKL